MSDNLGQTTAETNDITFPPDPGIEVIDIRVSSGETLVVPATVQGSSVQAVIDSGAEKCLMNKQFFDQLKNKPLITREVVLRGIGEGLTPAYEIEIHLQIGPCQLLTSVLVTTMKDEFLIGLDCMKKIKCDILLSQNCIRIGGEHGTKVPASFKKFGDKTYETSRVVMARRTVVQPHTFQFVRGTFIEQLDNRKLYCFEPNKNKKGLLVAASVVPGDSTLPVKVINDLDKFIVLKKGQEIGVLTEIDRILPDVKMPLNTTSDSSVSDCPQTGTDHNQPQVDQSRGHTHFGISDCTQTGTITINARKASVSDCPQAEISESNTDCPQSVITGRGTQNSDCTQTESCVKEIYMGRDSLTSDCSQLVTSVSNTDCPQSDVTTDKTSISGCSQTETTNAETLITPGCPQTGGDKGSSRDIPVSDCQQTENQPTDTVNAIYEQMPDAMKDMFEKSLIHLTDKQAVEFGKVLLHYESIFSKHELDLGLLKGVKHHIDTGDAKPVRQRLRRTPLGFEDEERQHLQKLLDAGVISESSSEWASPTVLIRKPDGKIRFCCDFRKLNSLTSKDSHPLPLIKESLDTLAGVVFLSTVDMDNSYYQLELDEESKPKTAFITRYGLFQHDRMGFGLCNAPAVFQRAMMLVLRGLTYKEVLAYLDDVIILGKSFEDHLHNLKEVFQRFKDFNLKLKPKKCHFFQHEVPFLGKVVNKDGVHIAPAKIEAVKNWPVPINKSELSVFLGFTNYHRDHIRHYAEITADLSAMTGTKSVFKWEQEHQAAFEELKIAITTAPCLAYPNPHDKFILDTDASDKGIGSELSQIQEGVERAISFGSNILLKEQRNWCTTRKELLSVVKFCRYFRHYLLGRKFLLRTDHGCLVWLMRFKNPEGQLARWLEELSQYDFEILHRPGKKHQNADGLSRIPIPEDMCDCYHAGATLQSLPCYPCKFCAKAEQQWGRFLEDVDDVIPLAFRRITQELTSDEEAEEDEAKEVANPQEEVEEVANHEEEQGEEQDSEESITEDDSDIDPFDSKLDGPPTSNWINQYSPQDIRQNQELDSDLAPILKWLTEDYTPTEHELFLQSPATKHLWLCRKQLLLKNDTLCYNWEEQVGPKTCLIVPKNLREEVLKHCHDTITSGHLGIGKTLARVRQNFMWYGIHRDVELYVSTCRTCSMNKKPRIKPRAGLRSYHAGFPMERIHLDFLGPFTPSNKGNKYVLMMIDQFTKWLECVAVPEQNAETVAQQFMQHFIVTFGCPLEVHTDQGKQFDSTLFKSLCKLLQIAKTRTTPYHPSSNGQIERYNRLIVQMIRCFVDKHPKDWDLYLPLLVMATHAMKHRDTGFTPNRLMLGREVMMPIDLIMGTESTQVLYEPTEWVALQEEVIPKIYSLVRKNLEGTLKRRRSDYDLRIYEKRYHTGDFVYQSQTSTKRGSKALTPVWKGPYLVIESNPPLYKLEDRRGRTTVLHHDRLKLCSDRLIPFWLRRKRHMLLDLDSTLAYDEEELHLDSQNPDRVTVSSEEAVILDKASQPPTEPCENPSPTISSEPCESPSNTLPPMLTCNDSNVHDQPDFVPLETSTQISGSPSQFPVELVDAIHSNRPSVDDTNVESAFDLENLLDGGILDKLFKCAKRKPAKPIVLGLAPKDPSSRGRRIKPPSHLQNFVC